MSNPAQRGLLVDARIRRGGFELALRFDLSPGLRLGVLGPNGAGKSTLLRAIAGLTPLSDGQIALNGRVLSDAHTHVPPEERKVAVVFQDHRLFPHLSVRDNVAFGPRSAGAGRAAARGIAERWLQRLDLAAFAERRPAQLSGGQAQRVALARALAQQPDAVLLDEPMAALDAGAKLTVRTELRRHLVDVASPVVFVTHDPVEALVLADRLLVLESGRVVQDGSPEQVARRPATPYVAHLMGLNLYAGVPADGAVALDGGGRLVGAELPSGAAHVLMAVRPSAITVHTRQPDAASVRNVWAGTVRHLELLGDRIRLQVAGPPDALVDVTPGAVAELDLREGAEVWLAAKATEIESYPDASRV